MNTSCLADLGAGIEIAKKKDRRHYRQNSKKTNSYSSSVLVDTAEVYAPQPKSHIRFLVAMIAFTILGLFLTLVVNALLTQGSFQIQSLNSSHIELQKTKLVLEQEIIELEAPSRLAHEAIRVGMVPNEKIAYINLATRMIVGSDNEVSNDIFTTKELISINNER